MKNENVDKKVAAPNSRPLNCYTSAEPLHVLSLGAGVQSSALALMAAKGEITPMPNFAVFADTQAEPESVYKWLNWLETQLPFPVYRVTKGDLSIEALKIHTSKKTGGTYLSNYIPAFVLKKGVSTPVMRQCTSDFKIAPIQKFLKQYKKQTLIQWLGISTDEAHRQKDSRVKWITNHYPLIENRISRGDCLRWMEENKFPTPPRSACIFCPFKSDSEWNLLRTTEPEEFNKAVRFDYAIREAQIKQESLKHAPYLHRSLKPLDKIQFRHENQRNLFGNECEGMCGI